MGNELMMSLLAFMQSREKREGKRSNVVGNQSCKMRLILDTISHLLLITCFGVNDTSNCFHLITPKLSDALILVCNIVTSATD